MMLGLFALLLTQALPADSTAATESLVKVEPRLLVKERHVFVSAGLSYFARGDYYTTPGVCAALSFYPSEEGALELKLGLFHAFTSDAALEILQRTGFIPDAHRPIGLAALGYRRSFGYGKVLVGSTRSGLLHFDFQGSAHAGAVFTDRGVTPALALSPGLLVRLSPALFLQLDVSVIASLESRGSGPIALGVLPALSLGARL